MTRQRALRWLRQIVIGFVVLTIAFLTLVPIGRYLARAAYEEGRILARRKPIATIIADASTDAALRAKLQLVLDARRFAIDSLGLTAQQEFTTFSRLDRDTLVLVLSAAYRDSLAFRTWWFPVVGNVPYKGFFDFEQGRREAKQVDADGYDAVLRPASAFSTLGYFNDPLLPTTLALDTLELANTIIHELVHTTYYAPGQAVFNESLANFAGSRGAERFFRARADSRMQRTTSPVAGPKSACSDCSGRRFTRRWIPHSRHIRATARRDWWRVTRCSFAHVRACEPNSRRSSAPWIRHRWPGSR